MKTNLNKLLLLAVVLFIAGTLNAQNIFPLPSGSVGIGTSTPNTSSILEVKSTAKGVLLPRMTKTQRDAIASPAAGLMIYQTNSTPGFYYYSGTAWTAVSAKGWGLTGNAGTNPATNFIGTTDNNSLIIRTNNLQRAVFDAQGNMGIGTSSPTRKLDVNGDAVFNGVRVGRGNFAISSNTAIGDSALNSNTMDGAFNTATGDHALFSNDEGGNNTANGYGALYHNTGGYDNTAIGSGALYFNTNGYSNTATGTGALSDNTTGVNNTATGFGALSNSFTGHDNTAIGGGALGWGTTGFNNTAVGVNSLLNNNNNNNTAVGYDALQNNTSGSNNAAHGVNALISNTTGNYNTATGAGALYSNTTATGNTANGFQALQYNTTGYNNTASGLYSLNSNTFGYYNTAMGIDALYSNNDGFYNTAIGGLALEYNKGSYNTAVGLSALDANTTGYFNTAVGYQALNTNQVNTGNTAVGYQALTTIPGVNNTCIGIQSNVGSSTSYSTAIGQNAVVTGNNKMQLGASTTILSTSGGYTIVSDGRFKDEVKTEDMPGLDFITKLRPVTYHFDYKRYDDFLRKDMKENTTSDEYQKQLVEKGKQRQVGFIAQEVEQVCNENKFTFNGIYTPQNDNDNYALDYSRFVVPLVKAVQELDKKNDDLANLNSELIKRIEALEQKSLSENKTQEVQLNNAAASLEQNQPNPFNAQTTIRYSVAQQYGSAIIQISDNSNQVLKTIMIKQSGKGELIIHAGELAAGTYQYSLIVDRKVIDTKQMVLTK